MLSQIHIVNWYANDAQANLPSAINVDTTCQEGAFIIDNIAFYKDAKLAADLTAEADWSRRGLYLGPHVRVPPNFPQFRAIDVLLFIAV
jgi:hypothetical protein